MLLFASAFLFKEKELSFLNRKNHWVDIETAEENKHGVLHEVVGKWLYTEKRVGRARKTSIPPNARAPSFLKNST